MQKEKKTGGNLFLCLIKRYQTTESGSDIVNNIFSNPENNLIILNITIVEVIQTFFRLHKLSEVNDKDLNILISSFYKDIQKNVTIYTLSTEHCLQAEKIISSSLHLKTLKKRPGPVDILQLAAVLDFTNQNLIFVSSDQDLNQLAKIHKIEILSP